MLGPSSQREIVDALRQRLQEEKRGAHEEFPSGLAGELPTTFRRETLVEYLADGGSGATALALIAAREACREGGALVVIDRLRTFYPPAAAPFGLSPDTTLIRPRTRKDELWALNQTLRCPGVGAVVCWPNQLEERTFRGLQIAAEKGGAVGLFIRPAEVRGQPAWSDMQLLIEALSSDGLRRLRIEVVRSRSGCEGVWDTLELDDETPALTASRSLPLAAELAAATGAARASRA